MKYVLRLGRPWPGEVAPRTRGRKGRPQRQRTPLNRRSHPPAAESYVPPAPRVSLTPPPLLSRSHVRSSRRPLLTSRTSLLQRGAARCVRCARLRPPAAATAEPPLAPPAGDGRPPPRPRRPISSPASRASPTTGPRLWAPAGPRKCRAAASSLFPAARHRPTSAAAAKSRPFVHALHHCSLVALPFTRPSSPQEARS